MNGGSITVTRREFLTASIGLTLAQLLSPSLRHFTVSKSFHEVAQQERPKYTVTKKIPQVCAMSCEPNCAYYVVVAKDEVTGEERAITLEGRPEDPVSRGKYCIKGLGFVDSMYDPDRLLVALKRTNPKGQEPNFVVVDINDAIKEVIEKLKKYSREEIILCSPGDPFTNRLARSLGITRHDQRAECFGTHYYINSLMITNPPNKYYSSTYTVTHSIWGYDYSNTKYMIWFGFSSFSKCSKAGILNHIAEGKRKGAKIVSFNPIRTPLDDAFADEFYPIKPGTDLAVALAMIKVIIDNKLYKEDFLKQYTDAPALVDLETKQHIGGKDGKWIAWCLTHQRPEPINECDNPALEGGPYEVEVDGKKYKAKPVFQLLKETVKDYSPSWASQISEVPSDVIERVAKEFAQAAPHACIPCLKRDAAGPNYANSWLLRFAINVIQALCGCIDHEGGVLLLHDVPKIPWLEDIAPPVKPYPPQPKEFADYRDLFPVTLKIYLEKDFSAPGHYGMLGYGLYKKRKPIKCVIFRSPYRGLYALIQPPMIEKVLEGMELVIDWNYYVDDLDYWWADYVFPAPHQFEAGKLDHRLYYPKYPCLVGGLAVRSPPGQCISWGSLAVKLGLALAPEYWTIDGSGDPSKVIPTDTASACLKSAGIAENLKEFVEKQGGIWIKKEPYPNYKTIREIGYGRPNGRIRLYIDEFVEVGHSPLPVWSPRWTEPEGEYRFSYIVTRSPFNTHSDNHFTNNPAIKKIIQLNKFGEYVWINPEAARELGLEEGDMVLIEPNPKYIEGPWRPIKAKVHITSRVARKDCILVFHGFGKRSPMLKTAKDFGYRDGDIIPQKNPEIVRRYDPTGMGWVEDLYVRVRKVVE